MQDNVLKKEFDQKTVTRLRNLIKGNTQDATGIQTGYTKQTIEHNEGDQWLENGKQYTIKNGIKQNVTKLDVFRQLANIPFLCPKCNKPLNTLYDKKMYRFHKKCLNCVTSYETELKAKGTYEEYEKEMINGNIKFALNDYEQFLEELAKNSEVSGLISEDGTIEKWIGNNKETVEKMRKQLKNIKANINS